MVRPPQKPIDSQGRRIHKGSRVRVIGVPDLSTMPARSLRETLPIFEHVRGTCKRVADFESNGLVMLLFKIRKGRHAGMHSIYIEPELLLVQRADVQA
jgi:hypothetical protein